MRQRGLSRRKIDASGGRTNFPNAVDNGRARSKLRTKTGCRAELKASETPTVRTVLAGHQSFEASLDALSQDNVRSGVAFS
jgi:hypothetical protein